VKDKVEMVKSRADIASFSNLTNEANVSSTLKIEAVILAKDRMLHNHGFDDPSSSKGTFSLKILFFPSED
jgi:hypothetical protein